MYDWHRSDYEIVSVELLFVVSREVSSFIFLVEKLKGKVDLFVFVVSFRKMRSELTLDGSDVLHFFIYLSVGYDYIRIWAWTGYEVGQDMTAFGYKDGQGMTT